MNQGLRTLPQPVGNHNNFFNFQLGKQIESLTDRNLKQQSTHKTFLKTEVMIFTADFPDGHLGNLLIALENPGIQEKISTVTQERSFKVLISLEIYIPQLFQVLFSQNEEIP